VDRMLKGLIKRLKGQPDFYEDLRDEQVALYQRHFNRIIAAVDLTNNTKWAKGQPYDRKRLAIDDETIVNGFRDPRLHGEMGSAKDFAVFMARTWYRALGLCSSARLWYEEMRQWRSWTPADWLR